MVDQFENYKNRFKYDEVGKETCLKIFLTKLEEAVTRKPHLLKEGEKMTVVANRLMKEKKYQRDNFLYFKVKPKIMEKLAKKGSMYLDVEKLAFDPNEANAIDLRSTSDCQNVKVKKLTQGISSIDTTFEPSVEVKNLRPNDVDFSKPLHFTKENLKDMIVDGVVKMEGRNGGFSSKYMVGQDHLIEEDSTLYGEPMSKVDNPLHCLSEGVGIISPYRYVAVAFCPFPLHIEDFRGINSANTVICGHPKVWIIIPKSEFEKLCIILENELPEKIPNVEKCHYLHKSNWVHPFQLSQWGIEYHVIVQRPGEMVVTGCATFHEGFNLGWNVATAINLILFDFMSSTDELKNRPHCVKIPRSYFRDLGLKPTTSSKVPLSQTHKKRTKTSARLLSKQKSVTKLPNYNTDELTLEEANETYNEVTNDCVHVEFYREQRSVMFDIITPYLDGKEEGYTDRDFLDTLCPTRNPYDAEVVALFFNPFPPARPTLAPTASSSQPKSSSDSEELITVQARAMKRWNLLLADRSKRNKEGKTYYENHRHTVKEKLIRNYASLPSETKAFRSQQRTVNRRKQMQEMSKQDRDSMNAKRRKKRADKIKDMNPEELEALRKKDCDKLKRLRAEGRLGKGKKRRIDDDESPASP